ncbi:MAG: glycosyltransferase family 2 protein [Candidatus Magnetominusculus sp. LBB02]|nr:glycosyltransferase family 2 protein [Candidatus Magnetominusculus sp. LBB02]
MTGVSVVIVAKNEQDKIEAALASCVCASEIVVIDAESEDRTVEICKKYTDKVYIKPWQGFAAQKQMAADMAAGPWIFILDADERFTPELAEEIAALISDTTLDGFYVPRKNFFLGRWIKHGGWRPDYTLRLFKKDKGRLEPRHVHEKVVVDGRTGYLINPIEHYTYGNISQFITKMDNYSTLSAEEKASKRAGIISFTVRPLAAFIKMYFLRLGFLDGIHGFILAVLYGCYTFVKYVKIWQRRINMEVKDSEAQRCNTVL